jgi:Family of unknown function (DUF6165)
MAQNVPETKNAANNATSIHIPVSVGELIDKITILQIKAERIGDAAKRLNVQHELAQLQTVWAISKLDRSLIDAQWAELYAVNAKLWGIEDGKRLKEAAASFDVEFIALARSVYIENDRRAAIKRKINEILGSDIIEEKSYGSYLSGQAPAS